MNGLLKKTTELFMGVFCGLFAEDEVKDKFKTLNINDEKSLEKTLGTFDEKSSFMKTTINAQERIIRAIQSLSVINFYQEAKSDIYKSMDALTDYPESITNPYWAELKQAYTKLAGDFTHNIRNKDRYSTDNHEYDLFPNSDADLYDDPT